MDHDQMAVHEELLRIIEDTVDADALGASISQMAEQYGPDTYSELLSILANLKTPPAEAESLWKSTWRHRIDLSARLNRSVNITVALLDYLLSHREGEYINRPKVIDILDYERVAQSAIKDGLTGVYNTGYIREQVGWELTKDRRFRRGGTIILFDLNKFKQCNDQHGHLAGDAVLRQFAVVLKAHTRRADVVGRYGGDEFLVLMPSTLLEGAFIVADRIRRSFEKTVVHVPSGPPEGISITTTGGIAEYRGDMDRAEDLIDLADQALYLGKRQGANRIYVQQMTTSEPVVVDHQKVRALNRAPLPADDKKIIGNRRFNVVSSIEMTPGEGLMCELLLADTPEFFPCTGLISDVIQKSAAWEVTFQPVETHPLDWIPINKFVLQYEREQKNRE